MGTVNKQEIISGLIDLGLHPGAGVIVHSSLRSFGYVPGGAVAVIEALMEVVTSEGTILMPSFNHAMILEEGWSGYYDPINSPTINGIIPDTFRKMAGVYRSLDPTHPVAAWGKHARRYTQWHHRTLTMGLDSPIGLLYQDGGFGLFLGVGFEANSFHHVVETSTGAQCLGPRTEAYRVRLPGEREVLGRTWGWREMPCPFTDEGRYPAVLRRQGLVVERMIGDCLVTFFKLADCYTVVAGILSEGIDVYTGCTYCPVRPRRVPQNVPSDWDKENNCLLPESIAWTY